MIRIFLAVTGLLLFAGSAEAAHIEPLQSPLSPAAAGPPILTIENGTHSVSLSLADIERRFPMKQSTLKTDFGMQGTFEGVLLSDVLATYGLSGDAKIIVSATDDYDVVLSRQDIVGSPGLLATRLDGKPINDPNKGPTVLVWPELEQAVLSHQITDTEWVWSIEAIRSEP